MKNIAKLFVFAAALVLSIGSSAFAATLTKNFEFGAGTANSASNKRTFFVPCGLDVNASVKVQRKGQSAAQSDVPITVELRSPAANPDNEGTVVATRESTASTTAKTVALRGEGNSYGCDSPWIVRVKPTSGRSEFAIYGDITVTFNDSAANVSVESAGNINLNSANSVEKNIGGRNGFAQGVLTINGEWFHNLGLMPIRMKIELINPQGRVVASDTGYASNEARSNLSKLRIAYRVSDCERGQWKVRITNQSQGHDAIRVKPLATLKPDCPN